MDCSRTRLRALSPVSKSLHPGSGRISDAKQTFNDQSQAARTILHAALTPLRNNDEKLVPMKLTRSNYHAAEQPRKDRLEYL
jgi:hypothetical protein